MPPDTRSRARPTASQRLTPKTTVAKEPPSPADPPDPARSSLPAWISTLQEADQPEPTVMGKARSSVPGAHEDMSWELQTETGANEGYHHEVS